MKLGIASLEGTTALGFDFGTRSIGVAVGQKITKTATPLDALKADQGEPCWDKVAELIDTWEPNILIVGVPELDAKPSQASTKQAKRFAKQLEARFQLPVLTMEEHLTTFEAKQEILSNKGKLDKAKIDSVAASLILKTWLRAL